jgi:cobalt-zinc-cadmium efflux system outer membrane protein
MTKRLGPILAMLASLVAPAGAQELPAAAGLTLGQAIAVALEREPSARAARAEVEVARGGLRQAGLRPNPAVALERRQEPGGQDTAMEASVEWPLDLFRRPARVAIADAEVTVASHDEADARRQLAADVAAAYGEVATAMRELAVTDDVLAAATGQLDVLRARAEQGSTPTLDRDMVDVDVRRMQADRATQAGQVDVALLRLKRLLGMAPDAPLRVTQTLEDLVAAGGAAPGAPAPVAARPDVLASAARVIAADARIAAARRDARPEVTLFGAYMRMDSGFPQQGFSAAGHLEPVRGQFNYLTAGAMVMLPLWNRQQGAIAAATAARQAAEARAEAARLTAAMEVAEAQVQYEQARRAVTLYQEGVRPLARRNLDTVRETYQLGRVTVFDVLVEQRRYVEAERAYTEALRVAYTARVGLGRATGDVR